MLELADALVITPDAEDGEGDEVTPEHDEPEVQRDQRQQPMQDAGGLVVFGGDDQQAERRDGQGEHRDAGAQGGQRRAFLGEDELDLVEHQLDGEDIFHLFVRVTHQANIISNVNVARSIHKSAAKRAAKPALEKVSAGLLLFRVRDGVLQVLLVHPGGPFWQHKDNGAWTIPKGGILPGEEPLAAAQREFSEETGFTCQPPFIPLAPIRQKSGKTVHAWAVQGDCDPARVRSISFEMEWPPYSGQKRAFPEVDRAAFFDVEEARRKIIPAQASFISELVDVLHKKKPAP